MCKQIVIGAALAASAVALVSTSSSAVAGTGATTAPAATTTRTAAAVIRPVTVLGRPANGFTVAAYYTWAPAACGASSAAAVDDNIAVCTVNGGQSAPPAADQRLAARL